MTGEATSDETKRSMHVPEEEWERGTVVREKARLQPYAMVCFTTPESPPT